MFCLARGSIVGTMSYRKHPTLALLMLLAILNSVLAPTWASASNANEASNVDAQAQVAAHAHHHHQPVGVGSAAPLEQDTEDPASAMHCEVTCEHCIGHCAFIDLRHSVGGPDGSASGNVVIPASFPVAPESALYRPPIR